MKRLALICGKCIAESLVGLTLLVLLATAPTDAAQDILFRPEGQAVKMAPFYSFQGNVGQFYANSGGASFGAPTIDTTLAPTDLVQMPDGRYLVNTLGGTIKLLDPNGNFISNLMGPAETQTTFVDPVRYGSTALVLHPNFASSDAGVFGRGLAYGISVQPPSESSRRPGTPETGVVADFTVPEEVPEGTPLPSNGWTGGSAFAYQPVIREYDLSAMLDTEATVTSYIGSPPPTREILRIDQPQASHGMFDIAFNAAGDLFVANGDGGFTELGPDFPGRVRFQSAQNLNEVFGKILRINPDVNAANSGRVGDNGQYSIPADNPYFDTTQDPTFDFVNSVFSNNDGTLDEIYANGVRSPFRLMNDPRDPTGNTLVLGDVGAGSREEVTKFTNGDNLGWGRFEGDLDRGAYSLEGNTTHTGPGMVYDHGPRSLDRVNGQVTTFRPEAGGQSISGGEIYAGSLLGPGFEGRYIGADLGAHNGNTRNLSRLFIGGLEDVTLDTTMLNIDPAGQVFTAPTLTAGDFVPGFDFNQPGVDFDGQGGRLLPELILGIHANNNGELFLLGSDRNGNNTISRIVRSSIGSIPGDVDGVNGVTIDDFNIIRNNLGKHVTLRVDGDLTGDGKVDLRDFQEWLDNVPPGLYVGSEVPEPGSIRLVGFAAVLFTLRIANNTRLASLHSHFDETLSR